MKKGMPYNVRRSISATTHFLLQCANPQRDFIASAIPRAFLCRGANGNCWLFGTPSIVGNNHSRFSNLRQQYTEHPEHPDDRRVDVRDLLAERTKESTPMKTMTNTTNDPNNSGNRGKRLVTSDLHPGVYAALIGLSLWSVAWVWSFFGAGVTPLLLFVVSGLIGFVIALWLILRSVRRPTEIANSNTDQPPSFYDWVRGDFVTEHGPQSSADAALIILLPILAAAIGMMVFGIEFQVVEHAM